MSLAAQLAPVIRKESAIKFARAVRIVDDRLDKVVPVKTGRLKRSRRTVLSGSGPTLSATIDYTARAPGGRDYGEILEQGRGPVHARPGGTLRFVIGGTVFYRRKVKGTKKHMGWFSRPTSATDWRLALNRVFGH